MQAKFHELTERKTVKKHKWININLIYKQTKMMVCHLLWTNNKLWKKCVFVNLMTCYLWMFLNKNALTNLKGSSKMMNPSFRLTTITSHCSLLMFRPLSFTLLILVIKKCIYTVTFYIIYLLWIIRLFI